MRPDSDKLQKAVARFSSLRILVLGDVMLDRFIWGTVKRISPEAPVPVVEVSGETVMLGGAGNVLRNLITLGARADLCGVVGKDGSAVRIKELVRALKADVLGLTEDPERPSTVKTRVIAHSQQLVRIDQENRAPLSRALTERLWEYLEKALPAADAVIVSDYAKGVVSAPLMARLSGAYSGIISVDPKVENLSFFRGATVITPNHLEAAAGAGVSLDEPDYVERAGRLLLARLGAQAVLITQGEQGMSLFCGETKIHIPTTAQQVYDVTGAGDTVIGVLTLGLAAGLSLEEAAWLANRAAGIVVGEVGTSAISYQTLWDSLERP
ncbi:MAG: D-glycero-beta-D-manno-heptose-7-phosphate kinase [Desulfarculales bacterium]|jgi:D-beta-D-heptose 7-phosphate kinase/D-beta-D-heptose 1-phosphate adenosyltransferase|nr:D-glycero-beta-D-manno-heptose-7-phosphate kinase [Desulfarculales bacterium]